MARRMICARAGEPLPEYDAHQGHTWCRDCREVDAALYKELTGFRPQSRRVDLHEAAALYRMGYTRSEIARRLGVALSSVSRALVRAGVTA